MLRDKASLEKNERWITSRPSGLSARMAASSIDIHGHCVRIFTVAPWAGAAASHHHHDGVFDQHLEGADQFGAERAVDRAVIAGQRHAHDVRRLDLAATYHRALLAGANREDRRVRRGDPRGE